MMTVYKNAVLLDGTRDMSPKPHTDIGVEGEKIVKIGSISPKAGDTVIDCTGKYIMPGLINLHAHMPAGGRPQKKPLKADLLAKIAMSCAPMRAFAVKLCHGYALQALYSGVTTVRAVGGLDFTDSALRDKINAGKLIGPRLLVADYAIGVKNGHMVGSVAKQASTPEDAVRATEELIAHGVDLIKLMVTGGVMDAKVKGEPGVLMMPAEMIKAVTEVAHKHGLRVAGHIQSQEGIRVALLNGLDTVEHGSVISEEEIRLFRQNNAAFVCTLSPAMPMSRFDRSVLGITEVVQYNSNVVYQNMIKGAITALENGIPVGLGTDTGCPYTTHYNMWRELHYFQKECKLSPEFVLFTATLQNARILGIDSVTGSIEEGKCADMVIADQNPLTDFRALEKPYGVVARGRLFVKPKIKKYPKCEEELDKYY